MQARWKTTTGWVIAAVVAVILFFAIRGKSNPPPATLAKSSQSFAPKLTHPMGPAAQVSIPPAGAAAVKPEKLQVCGISDLPPSVGDTVDVASYVFDRTRETYDSWKATLINGSDARARAVGLSLQRVDDMFAHSLAADTSLEQLVELATTTRDPAIYRVAVGSCHTGLKDEAPVSLCRHLSLSEWAKLDPDSVLPWLATAAAARNSGDSWAESLAFARAAQAHQVDGNSDSLLASAMDLFPTDATLPERYSAEIHMWGFELARSRPDLVEISRYCTVTALQQSQVHDQCEAVADLLVDHGQTLSDVSRGRTLGQLLGWPAGRLDQLVRERNALFEVLTSHVDLEDWSCGRMARADDLMKRSLQIGELAALRELQAKKDATSPSN